MPQMANRYRDETRGKAQAQQKHGLRTHSAATARRDKVTAPFLDLLTKRGCHAFEEITCWLILLGSDYGSHDRPEIALQGNLAHLVEHAMLDSTVQYPAAQQKRVDFQDIISSC